MSDLFQFLHQENIQPELLDAVREYRAMHAVQEALLPRIPVPRFPYYGKSIWEQAIAAVLCGENLLLAGGKATGKNVLAENLAALFGRPEWDISFHVNMDAASLIGTDTFVNGAVQFRPGPVYSCAQHGGFGILDEINMAKNEALAVLHAVLPVFDEVGVHELVFLGRDGVAKLAGVAHGDFLIPSFFSHLVLAAEGIEAGDADVQVGQRHGDARVAHILAQVGS